MKRRDFSALIATAPALGAAGSALAQGGPVEGRNYNVINPPLATTPGKIEVVEFFWYGCPHCNALEPTLDEWMKKLPADVAFRRVPVGFAAVHESHQRLFYALEAMGQLEAMHKRIFAAMHNGHQRLDKEADQVAFLKAQGVDTAKFSDNLKSFTVQTKARQAKQLAEAYKIDGVPALGVHGRFLTSGSMTGDNARAVASGVRHTGRIITSAALLLGVVIGAFATIKLGQDYMPWHFRFGYSILTLILFRIVWGFAGPRYARFASFPPRLAAFVFCWRNF